MIWYRTILVVLILLGFQFLIPSKSSSFLDEEIKFGEISQPAPVNDLVKTNNKHNIYFFGDLMLGRDVERRMKHYGDTFPFLGFSISSTSYAVANFESAVPDVHIPTPNNTFRFSTPKSSLKAVAEAGFTHLGLANNHTFDFGLAGYNQTVANIWESGLVPFGHPSVVTQPSYTTLDIHDKQISILAIHTLYNEPTKESLSEVFELMSGGSDLQIVYIHWGTEYTDKPSVAQRNFAKLLVELGADVIIGHHPHVVQSIELIEKVPVFYSLGNFVFDQYFSVAVEQGLVLNMTINNGLSIELIPVTSSEVRNQPTEMEAQNKAKFLSYLADISDPDLASEIVNGNILLE